MIRLKNYTKGIYFASIIDKMYIYQIDFKLLFERMAIFQSVGQIITPCLEKTYG
jgi:hypothetical protein